MLFFAYFRVSQKKNIKRSPNGMKPSERDFCNECDPEDLECKSRSIRGGHKTGGCAHPLWACPPISWAPWAATDLLPPIYTHIPREHPGSQHKTISTTVTFCIREIPSWSLVGAPPEGESTTEGFYINTIAPPMSCE